MSLGGPFVLNDFVAFLLRIIIVKILCTFRFKTIGELPLSSSTLCHAFCKDCAVRLAYIDIQVVAKLGGVCYVEIEKHDS